MSELVLTHPQPTINKSATKQQPTSRPSVKPNPDRFLKVPSIVIHPDSIIMYSKLEWLDSNSPSNSRHSLVGIDRHHHNRLSQIAIRKLQKAIKYLIFLAHDKTICNSKKNKKFTYKVGFITLTLASQQIHPDSFITRELLHQFLVEAKQKWKVSRYVWKAEYQRNGNIHYHILVDRFIPYQELRDCWNRIQNKHGYVDRAIYKNSSYSYNSTDIHSLYNINDVTTYITKYMSKSLYRQTGYMSRKDFDLKEYDYEALAKLTGQDINGIELNEEGQEYYYKLSLRKQRKALHSVSSGAKVFLKSQIDKYRIWGCSADLSNIKGFQGEMNDYYRAEIERLRNDTKCKCYDSDYYTVIYLKNGFLSRLEYPLLYSYFYQYIYSTFPHHTQQLIFDPFT
jgi:hypothetical protein